MKTLKLGLLITAMLFMNACAYNMSVGSKEAAAKGVTYSYDKFKKTGWLTTEQYQSSTKEPVTLYHLRAMYEGGEKSPRFVQVYGEMFSQIGWCFLNSAYDENGTKYKFTKVDKDVAAGAYAGQTIIHEHFAINLSVESLEKLAMKDTEFKAVGKKCDSIFKVDYRVAGAFLDSINKRINNG
jgi:hypothetical protein